MQRLRFRSMRGLPVLLGAGLGVASAFGVGAPEASEPDPSFMRVVESEEQGTVRLDMAIRLYAGPDDRDPTVALAGAIHVADPQFFTLLQSFLDAQDLVLYEGVKPRGVGADEPASDEERIERSESRLRFVGAAVRQYGEKHGQYPAELDTLVAAVAKENSQIAEWLDASLEDAWGRPIHLEVTERGFDLVSYGADGEPGGSGVAADLALSDQPPLTAAETGADPGIQTRLAKALDLVFQLDMLKHEGPTYRNADMSLDEVEASIRERGGDPASLLGVLDGSSMMAGLLKFGLAIIEASPRLQAQTKLVLMEAFRSLGDADLSRMPGLSENMQGIMQAIIRDRNTVVLGELQRAIDEADQGSTVAVVYGAGHMPDLQRRLVNELDFHPIAVFWLPAITVDVEEAGMSFRELRQMRMIFQLLQP